MFKGWVLSDTERQARQEKRKSKNLGIIKKKVTKNPKLVPGNDDDDITIDDVIDTVTKLPSNSSSSLFSSGNSIHWGFSDQARIHWNFFAPNDATFST